MDSSDKERLGRIEAKLDRLLAFFNEHIIDQDSLPQLKILNWEELQEYTNKRYPEKSVSTDEKQTKY